MSGEQPGAQEHAEAPAAPAEAPAADLPVAVEPLPGSEPLSPERERELARAAVVAALVALRHVEAMHAEAPEPRASRFAAPARAHRRTPAGSWRHRF